MVYKVDDEKCAIYGLIVLDHSESKPFSAGAWKYGDFGPAKPKIAEATGVQNYNIGKNNI